MTGGTATDVAGAAGGVVVVAAAEDRETGWDDQRIRLAVTFDTGDERYRWLTSWLFVAEGRLLGFGRLEYQVYRVA